MAWVDKCFAEKQKVSKRIEKAEHVCMQGWYLKGVTKCLFYEKNSWSLICIWMNIFVNLFIGFKIFIWTFIKMLCKVIIF